LYGPTECTVLVTRFCVDKLYDRVPIGAAIDNTRLYVLDRHDRLAPVGVAGELCIAGRGVARGYLNRPDLTEEKFTPNPFTQETQYARIYRSGDVVRFLPNGMIDFVGRRDFQIKIRGFRVELTEIEGRIREYPAVTNAAVVPMDAPGGGKCAVAYIVGCETVQTEQLNQFIEEVLPPYMVPAATVQVEFIPLNPNGKVDRRKLPPPMFGNAQKESGGFAQTELGKGIAEIVAGILGHSGFNATENLLRSGITSLSAIKLATQIEKRFHVSLPVKSILAECTVLALENMVVSSLLTRDSQVAAQEIDLGPITLKKIDLSVVTDPQTLRADERTEHIRAVLTEVLGDLQAGNTDDLTRAGLTSLSTIKLVTRLKKHFGVAPTVHELLKRATVKTIEEALLRASAQKAEQGEEIEEQAGYPLSGSQLGVYLDCLKRPDALLYNIPIRVDMPEGVEAQRLKQAAQTVIDAHPILKMHIADDAEEIQQIPSDEPARVALLEMTKEELAAHAAAFIQPFNLADGPLYRVEIISCGEKLSMLADFHHIVFDGASLDLFLHELAAAYDGQTLEKE
ncbi:MAG: AMP-binding protein, partial [Christensenella sp.]